MHFSEWIYRGLIQTKSDNLFIEENLIFGLVECRQCHHKRVYWEMMKKKNQIE